MSTIGTIELIAKIDTSQYKRGAAEIDKANRDMENSGEKSTSKLNSAFAGVAKVGVAALASAVVAVGVLIVKNLDNAVSRFDTLNNFPKVMANLGYETAESQDAIKKLDRGVRGLPTSLDSIASAMQNIAPSTKSIGEATDLALALNNAILAGGKPTEIQATAMEQFSQAIAKGKPDMMEWRSLATAMPGQLKQISNSLGYDNWQQMAEAVSDGSLSFDKVKESIIDLNKDGFDKFPSFADQAKNATGGISTSMGLMNTAITRGITGLLEAIGSDNIKKIFVGIGTGIESMLDFLALAIPKIVDFGKALYDFLKPTLEIVGQVILDAVRPAIDSLRESFKQIYEVTKPYHEQLKLVAMFIGAVFVGIIVAVTLAILGIIVVMSKVVEWGAKFFAFWITLGINIKNAMEGFGQYVRDGVGQAVHWFSQLPGRIMGFLGNLGGLLYSSGRDLISGLLSGINSAVGGLVENVKNIAGRISGAFKNALGIRSPSKVFAGFGMNIAQGLAGGIDKYSSLASGAIDNLATDVTMTMTPRVNTSALDSTSSSASNSAAPIQINLSGVMASSQSDLRTVAKQLVGAIDQERAAKQQPLIMGTN